MYLLKSCAIAFSMYSKIPMPRVDWNEKNMKYAMCFFPVVGAVLGVLEVIVGGLLLDLGTGKFLLAAAMTSAARAGDRRHPHGRLYGHHGCAQFLR